MDPYDLSQRLRRLERRIERVEAALDLAPPEQRPAPVLPASVGDGGAAEVADVAGGAENEALAASVLSAESEVERVGRPTVPRWQNAATADTDEFGPAPADDVPPAPPAAPTDRVLTYQRKLAAKEVGPSSSGGGAWERAIGLKASAWVGAIVIAVAAALGAKYAYDRGLFGGVPDAAKLVLMSGVGLGLIAAGEWVYRRVGRASAAGLYAAGVAALFVVSYAGFGYYEVYARQTAFALMAASAAVGAGVAARGRVASIGVLSVLGGNVAPLVLGGRSSGAAGLLTYLLALQAVALALAWWGASPAWRSLRGVSLATTALWVAGLLAGSGAGGVVASFCVLYAALYHGELIASAGGRRASEPGGAGVAFSTTVTALLAVVLLAATGDAGRWPRGAIVLALAAVAAAGWAALRRSGVAARVALSAGYAAQAAGLVVLAVPVALGGASVALAWAGLGVVYATAGARARGGAARVAGVGVWGLSAAWATVWALDGIESGDMPSFAVLGLAVPAYLPLAAIVVAAGHAVGLLTHGRAGDESCHGSAVPGRPVSGATGDTGLGVPRPVARAHPAAPASDDPTAPTWRAVAHVIAAVAGVGWVAATAGALPAAGATVAVLAYAWALGLADRLVPRRGLAFASAGAVAVAAARWVAVDLVSQRVDPSGGAGVALPLVTAASVVGLALAASIVGLGLLLRRPLTAGAPGDGPDDGETNGRNFAAALGTAVVAVLGVGLAFEVDRAVARLGPTPWPPGHLLALSLTILGAAVVVAQSALAAWAAGVIGRSPDAPSPDATDPAAPPARVPLWPVALAVALAGLLTAKYLVLDTLAFRAAAAPADVTPALNAQLAVGVAVAVAGFGAWLLTNRVWGRNVAEAVVGLVATVVVPLWAASVEVDRVAVHRGAALGYSTELLRQAGWSVLWSTSALAAIVLGFARRRPIRRYFGLALLAVTLLKVVAVDLSVGRAGPGVRILSVAGLGLLLLVTSVLYGKFAPADDADSGRR